MSDPTPAPTLRILHVEDNVPDAELIHLLLKEEWPGCVINRIETREALTDALVRSKFDLILSDFSLPRFDGLSALELTRERNANIPFIFISGTIGEDNAVEALRRGATDYVIKDRPARLIPAIRRALQEAKEYQRRQNAEAQLKEHAELLDKARDAIVVSNPDRKISYWNQGAERMFGWTAAEAIGRSAAELFGPGALAELAVVREALAAGDEWRGEINLYTKQGKPLIVESRVTVVRDEAGRFKSQLIISTDITEQKKLEEQLLHAQRLENIGMLSAGIAHDINNVLAPMLMAAPLLRQHMTDPRDLRMLEMLEKSAERGAGLVRQILGFAHGVGGEQQLVQVKHLLRDIAAIVSQTFPKSIQFEEQLGDELWPIKANPTQIHQVLLNLCVNARDALPQGGTLRVSAENHVLDEAAARAIEGAHPGNWLLLQVEDTGTGIPPDVVARIWDPFFTTKGVGKGTGLGLSTVRGIVGHHHGFIILQTTPGRGTKFSIYLPAVKEAPGSDHPLPQARRGNGELILVVDDEPNIRDLATAILTQHGYRVLVAADGMEAIVLLATRYAEVSLVITDLNMPNLGGGELASVVRRLNPDVKVLAMSGGNKESRSATPARKFADAFLMKPFKVETLLNQVQLLLHPDVAKP